MYLVCLFRFNYSLNSCMCCVSLAENKVLLEEDIILVVTLGGPEREREREILWSRGSLALHGSVAATLGSNTKKSHLNSLRSSFFIYKAGKKISQVSAGSKIQSFSPRPTKNYRSEAATRQFSQGSETIMWTSLQLKTRMAPPFLFISNICFLLN